MNASHTRLHMVLNEQPESVLVEHYDVTATFDLLDIKPPFVQRFVIINT